MSDEIADHVEDATEIMRSLSARMAELENFFPTPEAFNRLPTGIRQYIADLETRCDPSGDVQELVLARYTCRALELQMEELERSLHYSSGALSVAMKRLDEAEAENARLLSIMPPTAGAADPRFVGQGDWAVFADKVVAERDQLREDVRQAVADYMCSEGCSCCQDVGAHKRHAERLAQLLEVPKYEDRSGYNFYQYRSLSEEESS
jgi:hypothetical protein